MRKTQSVLQGRKYSSVMESWPWSWPWMYKAMGSVTRKQVKQWMGQEKAVDLEIVWDKVFVLSRMKC